MKIHPDGTLEGTPEELASFKKNMGQDTVYQPVYVPYKPWETTPVNPYPLEIWASGNVGPEVQA